MYAQKQELLFSQKINSAIQKKIFIYNIIVTPIFEIFIILYNYISIIFFSFFLFLLVLDRTFFFRRIYEFFIYIYNLKSLCNFFYIF